MLWVLALVPIIIAENTATVAEMQAPAVGVFTFILGITIFLMGVIVLILVVLWAYKKLNLLTGQPQEKRY